MYEKISITAPELVLFTIKPISSKMIVQNVNL